MVAKMQQKQKSKQQLLDDKFVQDVTNYFLKGGVLSRTQAKRIKKQFYTVPRCI